MDSTLICTACMLQLLVGCPNLGADTGWSPSSLLCICFSPTLHYLTRLSSAASCEKYPNRKVRANTKTWPVHVMVDTATKIPRADYHEPSEAFSRVTMICRQWTQYMCALACGSTYLSPRRRAQHGNSRYTSRQQLTMCWTAGLQRAPAILLSCCHSSGFLQIYLLPSLPWSGVATAE